MMIFRQGYNKDLIWEKEPDWCYFLDYGFVIGKKTIKQEDALLLTSKCGYSWYLFIAYKFSSHLWVFLFTDKKPTITTMTAFLESCDTKTGLWWVCTVQGYELIKSADFRACIKKAGYTLEITGAGLSFQNTIVERPHHTCAYCAQWYLVKTWSQTIGALPSSMIFVLRTGYCANLYPVTSRPLRHLPEDNLTSTTYVYLEARSQQKQSIFIQTWQ